MGRIIDIPQRTPAWDQHRATHRNASDAPAMMGCSPYESRTALLKRISSGIAPEFDARTAELFAEGHRCEALARPLAEAALDEDLSPLVMVEGLLSASLDGHTLDDTKDWEHKLLNDRLRAVLPVSGIGGPEVGRALPMEYRVQVAHQQHCSGAGITLFTASKWDAEGNLIEARHCWVERDEALIAQVVAGWAQFEKDLAEFKPSAPVVQAVASPMEHLPSVSIQTTGSLVVKTNLDVFGERLRAFVAKLPKEPETDQEFADLAEACKRLELAEKAIESAVNSALASVTDVEQMRVTALQLAEIARTTRLASEKVVKTRKDEIKAREVALRHKAMCDYTAAANARLGGGAVITGTLVNFADVIKGLRSLDSLRDKLDTALAQAKIAVDAAEKRIDANLKTIADAGQDMQGLFADKAALVQKDPEAVTAIVAQRVAAENARLQAIRDAEAARVKREAEAKVEPVAAPPAATQEPERVNAVPTLSGGRSFGGGFRAGPPAATTVAREPIKLGDLNKALGFDLREAFVTGTLKVQRKTGTVGSAVFFDGADEDLIYERLLEHVASVRAARASAPPPKAPPAPVAAPAPKSPPPAPAPAEAEPAVASGAAA